MAAIVDHTSVFTLVFAILGLFSLCLVEAQKDGFSVELIHRDSPRSPLYNLSETNSTRVTNTLRSSFNRVHRFKPTSLVSTEAPEADIIANSGIYLMSISVGTPSFDIVAVADTGSDIIWTQCEPCNPCFQQNSPLFDPSQSSTYEILPCNASQCENVGNNSCSSNKLCQYSISYLDGSYSKGDVAADTLALPSTTGSPFAVPQAYIGCGHNNSGTAFDGKTSGIIGLGGGNLSLISQLGTSIAGKFSYCLLPLDHTGQSSKMNFGSNAIVSGSGTVSTPLTKKPPPMTFYFLTLEAISVGTNRIKFSGSVFGTDEGNIVIDSGTTLTLLPEEFYSELESAVSSQIRATRVQGPMAALNLCYDARSDFAVPDITIHFTNADVQLQKLNAFVLVSPTVSCFTFAGVKDVAVYGNLAQMNFLIGYDTDNQTVSFKPTDCSQSNGGVAEMFTLGGINLMRNVIVSLILYYLL